MDPASTASGFQQFSIPHLSAISIIIAATVFFPWFVRRRVSESRRPALCRAFAALIILNEMIFYAYMLMFEGLDMFLHRALPLHFCGMSVYLTAYVLISRRQLPYELAYFWGLAGSTQAVATPALEDAFPSYGFVRFFLGHGLIIVGVIFATVVLRMRPRFKGIWITFGLSAILAAIVGFINYLLDANYMFLCEPPIGATPFAFLEWPGYLAVFAVIALISLVILWLPFAFMSEEKNASAGGS